VITVSEEEFNSFIARAMNELPSGHIEKVKNVAILWDDEPNDDQRLVAKLQPYQTLFGLYQGVPLTQRQGRTNFPPDTITIFRGPISRSVNTIAEAQEQVKRTLWHEIAHYFGLGHERIHELESS
jgi:predicted Zn-dependent protease with MMP-like domain